MPDAHSQFESSTRPMHGAADTAVPDLPPLDRVHVGMACFLCSEAAFFGTLLVAYLVYLGESRSGPTPAEALGLTTALANTVFLLTSSVTIALAVRDLSRNRRRGFLAWMLATIVLGCLFLAGTAWEWTDLIGNQGLTLRTNLFGTTYFTLVGFHAGHVTTGVLVMLTFVGLAACGTLCAEQARGAEMLGWYWHFVDGVWVVILITVYVLGR
ncbi:MAG: cytochrome c oxidase subunit 3 [Planctomycetes bacterium]|nr:cytochrome c oxidase subunit 3 [Planctomycetota bacterium]